MMESKNYANGVLENECDLLKELENYEGDYVSDGILELVDSFVPIHNNEIWAHVRDIQEDIEEAIAKGFTEDIEELTRIFQIGYFCHYENHCYEYLKDIAYNICVGVYNKEYQIGEYNDAVVSTLIETLAEKFSCGDSWNDLRKEFREKIETL